MPQLIETFGLDLLRVGFLTAIPYLFAAIAMVFWGRHAAFGPFWSLPTALLTGMGAAAGISFVNSMENAAGLAGPSVVGLLKQATGSFSVL